MSRHAGSIGWGIIIIVIGLIFILNNFGILDFWEIVLTFWPILLIWWGFTMIRRSRREHTKYRFFEAFGDSAISTSSGSIDHSGVFGDIRIKVENKEFSGGYVKNVFGKIAIDLTEVERTTEPARLSLCSVFGDILIRLPKGLPFKISGSGVFGTTTTPDGKKVHGAYKSPGFDDAAGKLSFQISHVFGDTEFIQ